MQTFTVVGFHPDTHQRFAETVTAPTSAQAEVHVADESGVVVVAVISGSAYLTDSLYAEYIGDAEAREQVLHEPVRA